MATVLGEVTGRVGKGHGRGAAGGVAGGVMQNKERGQRKGQRCRISLVLAEVMQTEKSQGAVKGKWEWRQSQPASSHHKGNGTDWDCGTDSGLGQKKQGDKPV